MATLELVVDATRAVSGSQQAEAALGRVKTAAEATGKAVADSGARMSAAFQASGGSIQVAGGIAQTAKAFADLNVQAGLFNTSRLLLEVGKTAQDFRELSQGIQQTTTTYDVYGTKITTAAAATGRLQSVMMTLGAVVRANPILTLATAVGAIAGAMSLFGSETKKAADAYDQLGNSFRKAQLDARTAAYLGVQYKPDLAQQQRDVFSMVQQAQTSGQGLTLQQLQEFGLGTQATRFLAQRGEGRGRDLAQEYMRTGGITTERRNIGQLGGVSTEFQRGMPQYQLTPAETQAFMRNVYGDVSQRMQAAAAPAQPFSTGQNYGIGTALEQSMQVAMIAKRGLEIEREKAELAERQAESLRQASDYAANIGSTVGAAFADVLLKTTSVRQAFQQIVASIARQGLADVGASIFRGVVGAVAGGTPTQVRSNTGAIPGGGAGSGATPGGG